MEVPKNKQLGRSCPGLFIASVIYYDRKVKTRRIFRKNKKVVVVLKDRKKKMTKLSKLRAENRRLRAELEVPLVQKETRSPRAGIVDIRQRAPIGGSSPNGGSTKRIKKIFKSSCRDNPVEVRTKVKTGNVKNAVGLKGRIQKSVLKEQQQQQQQQQKSNKVHKRNNTKSKDKSEKPEKKRLVRVEYSDRKSSNEASTVSSLTKCSNTIDSDPSVVSSSERRARYRQAEPSIAEMQYSRSMYFDSVTPVMSNTERWMELLDISDESSVELKKTRTKDGSKQKKKKRCVVCDRSED